MYQPSLVSPWDLVARTFDIPIPFWYSGTVVISIAQLPRVLDLADISHPAIVDGCANLWASLASVQPHVGNRCQCRDHRNKFRLPSMAKSAKNRPSARLSPLGESIELRGEHE
jgi:hypothetical protein